MCIAIICFPVCDVIYFEINLSFLTKPLSCMTNNIKYLNMFIMKRAFQLKQKVFFIIFKRFSVARNCPRTDSAPLKAVCLDVPYKIKLLATNSRPANLTKLRSISLIRVLNEVSFYLPPHSRKTYMNVLVITIK